MKALRVIFAILLAGSSLTGLSQNQKGYVKTLGRPNQKGQALSGVSIRAKGAHNAVLSKNDGTFTMVMTGKKDGDSYALQQVQKTGYELNDVGMIGRQYAFSTNVPITIVMVSQQQLQEDKLRIENKAYEKAEKNYKDKLTTLERQKKENLLTEEKYRQQLQDLQNSFSKYESMIGNLAEHYARTDYDNLDKKEREINLCIEKGELERADSLLQQIGIQKRIENIAKQLSGGQNLMAEAKSDLAKVLKKQQKDGEYLYQLYTIALGRFDNEKARFYIETRAELDTTNVDWQLDAGQFNSEFLADYKKAMSLVQRGLRNAKTIYGENSEQTVQSLYKMCSVYVEMKSYNDALTCCQKALDVCESLYENPHPMKAHCYNGLAAIYGFLGDYPKAFEYTKEGMSIREMVYKDPNEELAESYFSYGFLYCSTGKFAEGLENIQKSLDILTALRGEQYIHAADAYHNMGYVYMMTGNYSKAEEYLTKGFEIRKRLFGEKHPDISESLNALGNLCHMRGDYQGMLNYFQRSLEIRLTIYGEKNSATATSYNNVGVAYGTLGNQEKSLEYNLHALRISKEVLNQNNPELGVRYLNVASTYNEINDYNNAIENVNSALRILRTIYHGENHKNVASCYNLLGVICKNEKKYEEGIQYHQKALTIRKEVLGDNHIDTAISYKNIGSMYFDQEDFIQAIVYFKKALDVFIKAVGPNHPQTIDTTGGIKGIYEILLIKHPDDIKIQKDYQKFKDTYMQDNNLNGGKSKK